MIICGLKLTHDGAIALIDEGKLIFCYEMEKLNGNPRHSFFNLSMNEIEEIFEEHGYKFDRIDKLVIDGWDNEIGESGQQPDDLSIKSKDDFSLEISLDGENKFFAGLAKYGHIITNESVLDESYFSYPDQNLSYNSYMHVSGHIFGAYCTSPFAKDKSDSFILVWDGGMPPQLFYYNYNLNQVENLGILFPILGYIYINFPAEFEPFSLMKKDLAIAGKVMAYVAKGKVNASLKFKLKSLITELEEETKRELSSPVVMAMVTQEFIRKSVEYGKLEQIPDQDMITTFHVAMKELMIERLQEKVNQHPDKQKNICLVGGCALNIKWNSAVRSCGTFKQVWVPPFPNDSGSALGTACCEMIKHGQIRELKWDVYKGPAIFSNLESNLDWVTASYDLRMLANLIHRASIPILMLNDRAELGPRALGNRSILAPANSKSMKSILNDIKKREDYRPIAPICLESYASEVFDPGTPDPYMLYDHEVRENWRERVAAICHLDNTARL
ncbi:MAG: carbamoyltransferase N-terminal domain-containing protein, partial [Bacteroidota bacterium]